jgi:O-antigen/teichoic acid export membrane protein
MIPIRQLSGPAFSVAVPGFSIVQSDRWRLARFYLRAVTVLTWIAAPVFGFLFVEAKPIILLALGSRWGEAAPIFEFLVLGALGQLLLQPTIWLMVSRGESRRLRNLFLLIAVVLIAGYAVGLPFGIKGVALMGSAVLMLMLPWVLRFTFRGTALTLEGLGRVVLWPVLLCFASIILAKVVLNLWSPPAAPLQLAVAGLCFAVVYATALLSPSARNDFMTIISVFRNRGGTEGMIAGNVDEAPVSS